mmetsp:Transcript_39578/g.61744  ORF Transcript_39578/g.61744 Transcript_39578/m.61744 type:complete len:181 (+) Transcript_39578:567-1109(+)|eukprot:CAMPEP_0184309054 /NCGR_PEP_ID=MMETSP1049-20130417/17336_1 /TAXON_ID=77928 /ORGANISM="Proteomonas sulcata, Strain CCMP704" /LENGTH=180 /DNA_ID=CAMNT_0026621869 /DNA_START=542 /DNA_END=1084 /DNA_ORIENTATION=+
MAAMVGSSGKVIGVEHVEQVAAQSIHNIRACDGSMKLGDRILIRIGDGSRGCPEMAPYDAIHVGAAVSDAEALQAFQDQLKPGGRLIAPVLSRGQGRLEQKLIAIDKTSNGVLERKDLRISLRMVPLGAKDEQVRTAELFFGGRLALLAEWKLGLTPSFIKVARLKRRVAQFWNSLNPGS